MVTDQSIAVMTDEEVIHTVIPNGLKQSDSHDMSEYVTKQFSDDYISEKDLKERKHS